MCKQKFPDTEPPFFKGGGAAGGFRVVLGCRRLFEASEDVRRNKTMLCWCSSADALCASVIHAVSWICCLNLPLSTMERGSGG